MQKKSIKYNFRNEINKNIKPKARTFKTNKKFYYIYFFACFSQY